MTDRANTKADMMDTVSNPSGALLLDLDGVLVDTLPVMRTAWAAVRRQHRVSLPFDAYQQHLGRPFGDIMRLLGLPGAEQLQITYDAAASAAADQATIFPGVQDVLHAFAAHGWLLGVVTSKPLHRASPLLDRLSVSFATVRTPGTGRGKPAPDPLLLALVDLGVDPGQGIFVGDTHIDQEAARRAGLDFIHAGWGYGEPEPPLPQLAQAPEDLLRLLPTRETRSAFAARSTR